MMLSENNNQCLHFLHALIHVSKKCFYCKSDSWILSYNLSDIILEKYSINTT